MDAAASASPRRLFGRPFGDQRPFFLLRPLAIPCSPRSCSRPLWLGSVGLRVSAPAPADGAGPTPRFGDPPPSSGRSGAENRSAEDPQASGAARRLRTVRRSAPETRLASSSALSRGRPPTPTRTLVDLGAAPYNRSRCCSHAFRETTHSEGQCRWWRVDYYTRRPKAESLLSQGPRPVFVKTLYTLCKCKCTNPPPQIPKLV